VLFPTLSALNSPPTATGECLPLCPPTPPSPSEAPAPQTLRRPAVSHSVAPPGHAPSSRTVPNTVRVSSTSNRRRTTRCGHPALLSAVRSSRTSLATSPPNNSPSPPLSPSLSLLSWSSLSSLFRVVADAVAVALVAEVAAVVPVAAAVLDRELRPPTAPSNRSVESRPTSPHSNLLAPTVAVVAVPVLAVAVVVAVRVEAADAVPAADLCRCRSLVLSCRLAVAVGRRRSRVLATPRLPDETRPPPPPPLPNGNSLASRPEPPSRHAPEPSSCVCPRLPLPPPSRHAPPSSSATQTEPSPSASRPNVPQARPRRPPSPPTPPTPATANRCCRRCPGRR